MILAILMRITIQMIMMSNKVGIHDNIDSIIEGLDAPSLDSNFSRRHQHNPSKNAYIQQKSLQSQQETNNLLTIQQQQQIKTTILDATAPYPNTKSSNNTRIESIIQKLIHISHHRHFYVYDDPRFSAKPLDDQELYDTNKTTLFYQKYVHHLRKRYDGFALSELHLIQTLQNSPYRTFTPEDADWFFIPISLTHHLIHPMKNSSIGNVFHVLYEQPHFQRLQGNRHLLLVQTPNMWSWEHVELYTKKEYDVVRHYSILWNVTIGKVFDTKGCQNATAWNTHRVNNVSSSPFLLHDFYKPLQMAAVPMSRSSFSLDSIPLPSFPYIPASYEKLQNSTYLCFYRSRKAPSLFQSTPYRHALLDLTIQRTIQKKLMGLSQKPISEQTTQYPTSPSCSLGREIRNPQLWMEHFSSSKFCFVIRGDSPMSRSHLRAVKVGCIPVIVSDTLPYYSPIFTSSGISIEDYSIMITEKEFLLDPVATVLFLSQLEETYLRTKLNYLALAQRLFFPDHPQSLFVPALIQEMDNVMKDHYQWNVTYWPWSKTQYNEETPQLG
jgi:Exostosin family